MAFYVGGDLPVMFEAQITFDDEKQPFIPEMVKVSVFGPDNKFLVEDTFRPKTSNVIYVLKKKHVLLPGTYTFDFKITHAEFGEQPFKITKDVRLGRNSPVRA